MGADQTNLPQYLCRRYAIAVLGSNEYLQETYRGRSRESITWLLGWLLDGQLEVLAVWLAASEAESTASIAFEDVRKRGAEFIGVGLGGPFHGERAFRRLFQPSRVLPSIAQAVGAAEAFVAPPHRGAVAAALREVWTAGSEAAAKSDLARFERSPLGAAYPQVVAQCGDFLAKSAATFALPSELRQMVTSADCATADVRARLARAIQRHGPFASASAARDFVTAALRRAERRLDREQATALVAREAGRDGPQPVARSANKVASMAALA